MQIFIITILANNFCQLIVYVIQPLKNKRTIIDILFLERIALINVIQLGYLSYKT